MSTDPIRAALARLVELKDGPRDEHYRATKDAAWEEARRALSGPDELAECSGRLRCPRDCEPPCPWTGGSEAELIEHYIEVHHSPTAWAYEQVCRAFRTSQTENAELRQMIETTRPSVGLLLIELAKLRAENAHLRRAIAAKSREGRDVDGPPAAAPSVDVDGILTSIADGDDPPRPVCGDMSGPNGVGGECVLSPGHPHADGIGGVWPMDSAPAERAGGDDEPGPRCSKCGTRSCLEDRDSGWYDDEQPIMPWSQDSAPAPAPERRDTCGHTAHDVQRPDGVRWGRVEGPVDRWSGSRWVPCPDGGDGDATA